MVDWSCLNGFYIQYLHVSNILGGCKNNRAVCSCGRREVAAAPNYALCDDLIFGRMSFKGFNPHVEVSEELQIFDEFVVRGLLKNITVYNV